VLFLVFGFIADLKTLNPVIYTKPLQTVEVILLNLHEEGQVEKSTSYNLPHYPQEKQSNENKYALFRKEEFEN
jgi:hypothetical protein